MSLQIRDERRTNRMFNLQASVRHGEDRAVTRGGQDPSHAGVRQRSWFFGMVQVQQVRHVFSARVIAGNDQGSAVMGRRKAHGAVIEPHGAGVLAAFEKPGLAAGRNQEHPRLERLTLPQPETVAAAARSVCYRN